MMTICLGVEKLGRGKPVLSKRVHYVVLRGRFMTTCEEMRGYKSELLLREGGW